MVHSPLCRLCGWFPSPAHTSGYSWLNIFGCNRLASFDPLINFRFHPPATTVGHFPPLREQSCKLKPVLSTCRKPCFFQQRFPSNQFHLVLLLCFFHGKNKKSPVLPSRFEIEQNGAFAQFGFESAQANGRRFFMWDQATITFISVSRVFIRLHIQHVALSQEVHLLALGSPNVSLVDICSRMLSSQVSRSSLRYRTRFLNFTKGMPPPVIRCFCRVRGEYLTPAAVR